MLRDEKVSQLRLTADAIRHAGRIPGAGLRAVAFAGAGERLLPALAEQNRVRNVPILAPRGKILDREGRIIVDNYPSFSALLLRDQ